MMPEYEKNHIVEYTNSSENKLVFGNNNDDKMIDLIKEIVNIIIILNFNKNLKN